MHNFLNRIFTLVVTVNFIFSTTQAQAALGIFDWFKRDKGESNEAEVIEVSKEVVVKRVVKKELAVDMLLRNFIQ